MSGGDAGQFNVLDLVDELEPLDAGQRQRRLDELAARGGLTPDQRRQVEECLAQGAEAEGFMQTPPAPLWAETQTSGGSALEAEAAGPGVVPHVPGYEVQHQIGQGGMGSVWRAVQLGTRRSVALKLMHHPLAGAERVRARFDREVQITASLEHPNIARVFDTGVHRGAYYYAMELVEPGLPLDEYARNEGLKQRQVLELMLLVCRAVAHAHQNGVIHRDLKPSNILVSQQGQPKVVDFGLAKAVAEAGVEVTTTEEGSLAGTPAYMSPEQAAGGAARLDTRSDVYTLGVILYRLLTGRSPHELSGSRLELLRRISEQEVTIRPGDLPHNELRAVLLKALARDRNRRYASAAELAADLDRLLNGEPVSAREPTLAYLVSKRLRRHWPAASAAAIALLAISTLGVFSYRQAVARRTDAETQHKSEAHLRGLAEARARQSQISLGHALINEARAMTVINRQSKWREGKQLLEGARRVLAEQGADTFIADVSLWAAHDQSPPPLLELTGHQGAVVEVAYTPDGRRLLSASADGTVRAWDAVTGRLLWTVTEAGPVLALAVSPDGRTVALAAEGGPPALLDAVTGGKRRPLEACQGHGTALAFSADSASLVVGTSDPERNLYLFDLSTPATPRLLSGHTTPVRTVAFSPDGKTVYSGAGPRSGRTPATDVSVRAWQTSDGKQLWRFSPPHGDIGRLCVVPTIDAVLFGTMSCLQMLNARSGQPAGQVQIGSNSIPHGVAVSPNGVLASWVEQNGAVLLWFVFGVGQANYHISFAGHTGPARAVAFSPAGDCLASGGDDGVVRVWPVYTGSVFRCGSEALPLLPAEDPKHFDPGRWYDAAILRWSDDGLLVFGQDWSSKVASDKLRVWDAATGRELRSIPCPSEPPSYAGFAGGGRLAWVCEDSEKRGRVGVWDLARGQRLSTLDVSAHGTFGGALMSPDGSLALAWFGPMLKKVGLFEAGTGRHLRWFPVEGQAYVTPTRMSRFSPDGSVVAVVTLGGGLHVWDVATGRERFARKPALSGRALDISPDGRLLAAATRKAQVELLDLSSGRTLRTLHGVLPTIGEVAFSPDGKSIWGTGYTNGCVWDTATGELKVNLETFSQLYTLAPSPAEPMKLLTSRQGHDPSQVWDLSRPARYRAFREELAKVGARLAREANDGEALRTLGRWYAFRGYLHWACELLEAARARGAEVPALELARCHWRNGDGVAATRYFRAAIDAAPDGPQREYLRLCLAAVEEADRGGTLAAERPAGANFYYTFAVYNIWNKRFDQAGMLLDLAMSAEPTRVERGRAAKRILEELKKAPSTPGKP